jgi:hypothetical protein
VVLREQLSRLQSQAIDALLALDEAAEAARAAGSKAISPEILKEHENWYRKAAAAGIALNAGRHGKLGIITALPFRIQIESRPEILGNIAIILTRFNDGSENSGKSMSWHTKPIRSHSVLPRLVNECFSHIEHNRIDHA